MYYDNATGGSENKPTYRTPTPPVKEENKHEWFNENGEWEYWGGSVEERLCWVEESVERFEAAIFGEIHAESVGQTHVQEKNRCRPERIL